MIRAMMAKNRAKKESEDQINGAGENFNSASSLKIPSSEEEASGKRKSSAPTGSKITNCTTATDSANTNTITPAVNKANAVFNLMANKPEYSYIVENPGAYESERRYPIANDTNDLCDEQVAEFLAVTHEEDVPRTQKYLLECKGDVRKAVDLWWTDNCM